MSTSDYTVLSVYSHKGGVGKTTVVDTIASAVRGGVNCSERLKFKRVLMIDLDTQMNLTQKLLGTEQMFEEYLQQLHDSTDMSKNRDNADIKTKLTRLMDFNTRNDVNPNPLQFYNENDRTRSHGRCIHFIPGFMELATMTKQMTMELDASDANLNNCRALKNLIQMYVDKYAYDLVIIDLGPDLYTINACALWSSDYVLIPCTADIYSAMSFRLVAEVIFPKKSDDRKHPYHRFGSRLRVVGYLPNRVKVFQGAPTSAQQHGIAKLHDKFSEHLMPYCAGLPATANFIQLIGGDLTNNEITSLIDLQIKDEAARGRLAAQLTQLVRWLNTALN